MLKRVDGRVNDVSRAADAWIIRAAIVARLDPRQWIDARGRTAAV
jgi:hypothetical protein